MINGKNANVLLIGGTGRSGTNLLKNIFSKRSDVYALPFESRFTVDPDGVCVTYNILKHCWSPMIAEQTINRFSKFMKMLGKRTFFDEVFIALQDILRLKGNIKPYKEWELDKWLVGFSRKNRELIGSLLWFSYRGGVWPGDNSWLGRDEREFYGCACLDDCFKYYLNGLYNNTLNYHNKSLYVDDNTFNILHASTLLELLPNAKLIHMIRDPRDVVASYIKQRWTPNMLSQAVVYYRHIVEAWKRQRELIDRSRFIQIKFESLCLSPKRKLKEACKFMDLDYQDEMMEVYVDSTFVNKWQRDLTENQQQLLNRWLKEDVQEYINE